MDYLGDLLPGCRFRYQGRTLIVRAATTTMVVAVPVQIRGEPDDFADCLCIAKTELRESDLLSDGCTRS